ncbi:PEP-CTERM sorting domain-containing protein [Novosphingopyxis sp. YJ-S2-01]|uniref:PEP-CTERM sorting domain-containing protein n=1 Tax=Novosphingopyxis sp. YJ-S2-01 TaxID=2794021 RepID=UPI001E4406F1|nr:PEP-CTERM sorting domain-containing protein [Novosphingopyxis sp. YJ-S2-01]
MHLKLIFASLLLAGQSVAVSAQSEAAAPETAAPAQTVLFVGNSFTYGALSPVWHYRADTVTDLNGEGVGGVPALFKLFTEELGLNYDVYLETSPGKSLEWHWQNKAPLLDRAWDHVALQDYSTLNPDKPADPANLITYSKKFSAMFEARNPKVDIGLTSTWSRPDLTYRPDKAWTGRSIYQMALDIRRGYDAAKAANEAVDRVNPVGEAFNCAIAAGVADANPYDGTSFGQVDLWTFDHYHGSAYGYYLEALVLLGSITGKDPRLLGGEEEAASELGLSPEIAVKLQAIAARTLNGTPCDAPFEQPS